MNTKKSFDENQIKLIHSRFKKLREETETNEKKALSQRELSKLLNVVHTRINRLESKNDDTEPSLYEITAYSRYFDVSIDYLLGLSNESTLNVEDKEIAKKTGLSVKSLKNLKRILNKDDDLVSALNEILEAKIVDLSNLLFSINRYFRYYPKFKEPFIPVENQYNDYNMYLNSKEVEEVFFRSIGEYIKKIKENSNSFQANCRKEIERLEFEMEDSSNSNEIEEYRNQINEISKKLQ